MEQFYIADTPFTIVVPKLSFDTSVLDKGSLEDLVLGHIMPGVHMKSLANGVTFGSLNHNAIHIKHSSPEKWTVNDVNVLKFNSLPAKQISFIEIDGYLNDRKNSFAKRNIQEHNR